MRLCWTRLDRISTQPRRAGWRTPAGKSRRQNRHDIVIGGFGTDPRSGRPTSSRPLCGRFDVVRRYARAAGKRHPERSVHPIAQRLTIHARGVPLRSPGHPRVHGGWLLHCRTIIGNLLKRAGDRLVAACRRSPAATAPRCPASRTTTRRGGPELRTRRPDATMAMIDTCLTNRYSGARAGFVYTVTRDFSWCCPTTFRIIPMPWRRDSTGGASCPHFSSRPSTCCNSAIYGRRRPVAPRHFVPNHTTRAHGSFRRWIGR